jgi:hypothetical protein
MGYKLKGFQSVVEFKSELSAFSRGCLGLEFFPNSVDGVLQDSTLELMRSGTRLILEDSCRPCWCRISSKNRRAETRQKKTKQSDAAHLNFFHGTLVFYNCI